jgi:hypothetical protein
MLYLAIQIMCGFAIGQAVGTDNILLAAIATFILMVVVRLETLDRVAKLAAAEEKEK